MRNELPLIQSYVQYKDGNEGDMLTGMRVKLPGLTLYQFWDTIVAFYTPNRGLVVRESSGPSNSRYLDMIDGGNYDMRLPLTTFEAALNQALDSVFGKNKG